MEYKCINGGKSYHKFAQKEDIKALENINLSFSTGEILGIIGLPGSGKTTLIDVLSGNLELSEGELNYSPESVVSVYKPNGIKLNKNLSIYDNMVAFGKKGHMNEVDVESRMVQLRDIFSLSKFINTKVGELNEENRVKCEMVMSLLNSPRIIFVDDALSTLAHSSKNEILKCLKRLNKEERTIIVLVSPDLKDVDKIINRIVVLDKANIIYDNLYSLFKEKYCANKIFEVFLNKNISIETFEGVEILEKGEYYYKLSFANKNGMLSSVINLFDVDNIVDLTISNVNLKDIVDNIRKGE